MLNFLFGSFYHSLEALQLQIKILETTGHQGAKLNDLIDNLDFYVRLKGSLKSLKGECLRLELIQSSKHIDRIIAHLAMEGDHHNFLLIHLKDLLAGIYDEGENHLVITIPAERGKLLHEEDSGFWGDVFTKFPSANADCDSAVYCYACDQGTASVFHSMRILECGLKALSDALGLPFGTDVWHVAIDRIESEIRDLERIWPKGNNKSEFLKFYSEAAKEFRYFKDGWRNYVSHRLSVYDAPQAFSTMNHVKDFMLTISSRLSEVE
jgi:hypothetical protein